MRSHLVSLAQAAASERSVNAVQCGAYSMVCERQLFVRAGQGGLTLEQRVTHAAPELASASPLTVLPVQRHISAATPSCPDPAPQGSSAPSGHRKGRGSCRWNGYIPTRGAAPG